MDFGLARLLAGDNASGSRPDRFVGTPAYMSPEQVRGDEVDHRSDIFSFGAVLYQMTTGLAPFRGGSSLELMQAVIEEKQTPPRELNPLVPPRLAEVIDRALAKSPDDRYQSVDEMTSDLKSIEAKVSLPTNPEFVRQSQRRRMFAVAGVAALLAVALGWFVWRSANENWARRQIPEILALAKAGRIFDAYDLAVRTRGYLPADEATLAPLMPALSTKLSVTSDPSGASVYLKRFSGGNEAASQAPEFVGTTPIKDLEIARGSYVVSIEKEGFVSFERTWSNAISGGFEAPIHVPPKPINVTLTPLSKQQPGMVFVPGGEDRLVAWWYRPTDAKVKLDDFFIDKFEVTNRDFKKFVDADGYKNERFWPEHFVKDGRKIPREDALRELVDTTGQPGPHGWAHGTYPEGKADHPVTGVTWYEAAAYAAFRGKSLPTIFQWDKAALYGAFSNSLGVSVPWGLYEEGALRGRANFDTHGSVPVGSFAFGMSPFGCYEMAGNVSEWCRNESSQGFIASGGSWASRPQAWGSHASYSGFYRSDKVGFRCVLNSPDATGDQGGTRIELDIKMPQYAVRPEAEVRSWFKQYYEYDKDLPLVPHVETAETNDWYRDRIEYNGAGGQRAIAYLYRPKHVPGPHQVIHLKPAGDVFAHFRTVPESIEYDYDSFLRAGRAVFAVVLRGNLEREHAARWPGNWTKVEHVEDVAHDIADQRRGLDYLLKRGDIDAHGVAFLGASIGGGMLVLPAIESRYRAVIISGFSLEAPDTKVHAAANSVNFLPLIRPHKLLIHGEFDELNPLKTVAEPAFNLLAEPKEKWFYPDGHRPDSVKQAQAVNEFLDKVIGPVKKPSPK